MNNSCVVIPYIYNKLGKVVKSILYEDILNYTKDRKIAKLIYADSQDSALIEEHSDYINYDENGEITLESVLKITKVDIEKLKVLNHLNFQIGNSEISYNEAVPKLLNFNQRSPFRDQYMAILIPLDKGKYKIHVVENNDENKQLLYDEVFNSSLLNRLIYRLAEAGCSVEFLSEAPYEGRYSTKNALKTVEGLYNLISVLNGETLNPTLLEESGHFILGSLGNNPLTERLLSLMSEGLLRDVLGDEYSSKVLGNNSQRETAGVLIGKALQNVYDNRNNSAIKNLIDRIINFSKKLFARITRDLLALDIVEAREIAESIAEEFLFKDFTGTAETALETLETLFNKKYSETLKMLNNLTLNLKTLSSNLKSVNKKLHKLVNSVYIFAEQTRGFSDMEVIGDAFTASCIVSILQKLLSILEYDVSTILSQTNVINNNTENLVSNGINLLTVRTYVKSIIQAYNLIQDGINSLPHNEGPIQTIPITNALGLQENIDLQKLLTSYSAYIRNIVNVLQKKEDQHFLNFLETTYGSKYITRAARMVFSKKYVRGEKAKDMERIKSLKGWLRFLETRVKQVEETTIPILDYMHYLERDCSFLDKHLWPSRKNKDIIVAITKKSIEQSTSYANRIMENDLKEVLELESRYKKLYKEGKAPKMREFYERHSDTNEFTSNYLDERNYGEWERKYKEFKESCEKEFLEQYPENNTLHDSVKAAAFHEWFASKNKKWHKDNSEYIEDPKNKLLKIRVPKLSLYSNNAYYQFKSKYPEAALLLLDIKSLKVSMDTRLENGSTTNLRAPLFYGTTINRFRNNRESYSFLKAAKKTLRLSFELMSEDMTDDMYGNDLTYNNPSDMLYYNAMQFNNDLINRLTSFGILPLKDTKKMSTDLFGTLLMYSNMSSKYFANSLIVNTLEVGREVLSRRKVEGNLTEEDRGDKASKAFNSYCKELDLRFYKKSGLGIHLSKNIVYRNIINLCNSVTRTLLLGGNVAGAITNVGTGSIEMFKEAVAGEFFSLNTFKKAVLTYYRSLPKHILESGKDFKLGKLDLFALHFDVLDDNTKNFNNHYSERNRALNMLLDIAFMPYSQGEHYMQLVPYIAMGLETNLYQIIEDSNGIIKTVETNLWDAYTLNILGDKLNLQGKYLKSKKDLKEYKLLKSIYSKIDTVEVKKSIEDYKKRVQDPEMSFSPSIDFTLEELEYINNNKINPWILLDFIPKRIKELLWDSSRGSKDEADFQWKCRQVTNQMHGVYNYIDKLAFLNTMLGELVMAMRGYAIGMLDKRFSGDKFDVDTKTEGSGYVTDAITLILSTFTSYGSLTNTALGLFAPVIAGDYVLERLKAMGFGEHQYKNMRRASMDMLIGSILFMIKILTGLADDEDEDAPWILGTLHYFSSRLLKEQLAFNSVKGIKDEIGNILGLSPIAFSAFKDIFKISSLLLGLNFYTPIPKKIPSDKLPLGYTYFYYNSSKDNLYTYGQSKGWTKLKKYIPYYRVYETVIKNPYEAETAFSYTKKIKQ